MFLPPSAIQGTAGGVRVHGGNALTANQIVRQVVVKRASDNILDELRRMIVMLELPPGAVYTEIQLADLLQCSRTPLREALSRLERERLVNRSPHRGLSIAELSMVDLGPLLEAADRISGIIAELAVDRITPERVAVLEQLIGEANEANVQGDLPAIAELHFEFHHVLAEATGNGYLVDTQDILQRLVDRFVLLALRRAGITGGALSDHSPILDAIKTGDPQCAVEVVRRHWISCRERAKQAC